LSPRKFSFCFCFSHIFCESVSCCRRHRRPLVVTMAHAIFLLLLLQPLLSCALAATDIQSANPTIRDTQSPSTEAGEESLSQKLALSSLEPRNSSKPFALRTLPLGASITWGYKSPDGNGYREFLRNNMTSAGWEVNMVGSLRHGSMTDNVSLVVFSFFSF
jgi:hypothetical protein